MTYSQLLKIVSSTELSAEQLAPVLGVSNMTIRRWRKANPKATVPKAYERLLVEGVQQMVIEGRLSGDLPVIAELLGSSSANSVQAALKSMGVSAGDLTEEGSHQDRLIRFLHTIGFSEKHRGEVDEGVEKINTFKKLGQDWRRAISVLVSVIRADQLSLIEKLVAYGALFYLLCPLDLVPDQIPIFGLTDDFAILTMAAAFYMRRELNRKRVSIGDGLEAEQ